MEEGKEEGKIEVILRSHEAGLDVRTISKITEKSVEEIKKVIQDSER